MKKGKRLISVLHNLFKGLFYINLVVGMGMVVLQIINLIVPKFEFAFSYFGKYQIELKQAIAAEPYDIFIDTISGSPTIIINDALHKWWLMGFVVAIVLVTLAYNYLVVKVFASLQASIQSNSPFSSDISIFLRKISGLSFGVFAVGGVLSVLKLVFLSEMKYHEMVVKPVFDNGVLNFLWLGIGFFILNEIYKVGVQLKKEQELTI